jgi:ubiquinone/menaquinone biosynthesis C-methylase UbiE
MNSQPGSATVRDLILGSPYGWAAFKAVTRGARTMRAIVDQYVQARPGESIIDVGCGYGDLARCLKDVKYVGIDLNPSYIEFARRHNSVPHAEFLVGDASRLSDHDLGTFDCAVLVGVLPRLSDDQATSTLRAVSEMLQSNGRLVAAETVFDPSQRTTARILAALDRGRYVRDRVRYEQLVSPWFGKTVTELRHDLFWYPYTHCMILATIDPNAPIDLANAADEGG